MVAPTNGGDTMMVVVAMNGGWRWVDVMVVMLVSIYMNLLVAN